MATPVTIDGVDIRSAAILNRDCAFPITSLRKRCAKDQAFQHIPIWYGGWDDGVSQPAITGVNYTVDTTASANDACKAPIVRAALTACELKVPNMKCIKLSTDVLQWKDLVNRYCRQRAISSRGGADFYEWRTTGLCTATHLEHSQDGHGGGVGCAGAHAGEKRALW